ncbi:hypothetical protein F444_17930 [Phytophthora nicotianae P1976]|uniref:Uncharacterized protein n=1 Tax=Phytophthora nicotianae P1976 TaxID=1317066 RepID=A0A080ZDD6_PHYNI|nr:hypothetical protein F444_17930 [Phytophthora nicotianae P1976]
MPDANFPDNADVQAFLRGPYVSMNTIGVHHFNGNGHARNYAAKWMCEQQVNASFTLETEGRAQHVYVFNEDVYSLMKTVFITKTWTWFGEHQKKLVEYKEELNRLSRRYGGEATGNPRKRARIGMEDLLT